MYVQFDLRVEHNDCSSSSSRSSAAHIYEPVMMWIYGSSERSPWFVSKTLECFSIP